MVKTTPLQTAAGVDLVGYDYFAKGLGVQLRAIYAYASKTNAQRLKNFPDPVTPPGHRAPLFAKADADSFIAARRAGSPTGKGRVKAQPLTKAQRAEASAAADVLGKKIDLGDRRAVRVAIYEDLELPVLTRSKREDLPAVDTATIKTLYKQTGHPFLRHLLTYRGVEATPPTQGA